MSILIELQTWLPSPEPATPPEPGASHTTAVFTEQRQKNMWNEARGASALDRSLLVSYHPQVVNFCDHC
jgi:hypothetical protein